MEVDPCLSADKRRELGRPARNCARRVLLASLIGTTIEFFDFYIYATAAVLVFPALFFPTSDPTASMLQSLATFALAFVARPLGSALFGHFGDRIGRKSTLVASLLTMGLSTVAIGLLPTYTSVGVLAPLLLALCRFGQGLGLGGEWGGAVLLAIENAPPHKRAWYGMFPQLGAPLGFICASGAFLLLDYGMNEADFTVYGWRIPFLASALLVFVGLYVRLQIMETPAFQSVIDHDQRVRSPILSVLRTHRRALVLGTLAALSAFVMFYLMTVFALSWGTSELGYPRTQFLLLQLIGVLCFALTIPLAALWADRQGPSAVLLAVDAGIVAFGFIFAPLLAGGSTSAVLAFLCIGFALIGLMYGPLGTALAGMFPTAVRYTGASLTFNLAGILGASLAPYVATWMATHFSLASVGYYLSAAALITLVALMLARNHPTAARWESNAPRVSLLKSTGDL